MRWFRIRRVPPRICWGIWDNWVQSQLWLKYMIFIVQNTVLCNIQILLMVFKYFGCAESESGGFNLVTVKEIHINEVKAYFDGFIGFCITEQHFFSVCKIFWWFFDNLGMLNSNSVGATLYLLGKFKIIEVKANCVKNVYFFYFTKPCFISV